MITLPDFLLARLAERERTLREIVRQRANHGERMNGGWDLWGEFGVLVHQVCDFDRQLAEIEALRQVVDLHRQVECVNCTDRGRGTGTSCLSCHHDDEMGLPARYDGTCATLRALAGAWSHHPDFNPAWRTS